MNRFIIWLSTRKALNVTLLALYFVLVVAPHKRFGTFINKVIFKGVPRDESNLYVITGALIVLIIYGVVFFVNANKRSDKRQLWFFMITNIIMATLIINVLFVNNVEVIHFPQYASFAILLFPIIGNYRATLVWSTIFGSFDEAYQYFYLAPLDTSYYDLNDVVTNLIGTVFGLLLLRSFAVKEWTDFRFKSSSIWIGLSMIAAAIVIVHLMGLLSIYPDDSRPYHILREWPPGFWTTVHPNVTFHVIRPIEGLLITILLWIFYSRLSPNTN